MNSRMDGCRAPGRQRPHALSFSWWRRDQPPRTRNFCTPINTEITEIGNPCSSVFFRGSLFPCVSVVPPGQEKPRMNTDQHGDNWIKQIRVSPCPSVVRYSPTFPWFSSSTRTRETTDERGSTRTKGEPRMDQHGDNWIKKSVFVRVLPWFVIRGAFRWFSSSTRTRETTDEHGSTRTKGEPRMDQHGEQLN